MRVVYVGKHGSGGNDDEGAIAEALISFGSEVVRIPESDGWKAVGGAGDFLLFHGWDDLESLRKIRIPKVFWYFDLVDYPDPAVSQRCQVRTTRMNAIIPLVDLGFCTDGDWVSRDCTGKLLWLPQGADVRVATLGSFCANPYGIVFSGSDGGLGSRVGFIQEMRSKYGKRFVHVQNVYREDLARLISRAEAVVAPDSPVTDRYWSNRVYIALGFGGLLFHPYSAGLAKQYDEDKEIVFYRSRYELHLKLEYYRRNLDKAWSIRRNGFLKTVRKHTYHHRVFDMLRIVGRRFYETDIRHQFLEGAVGAGAEEWRTAS